MLGLLMNLDINKAVGMDGISGKILRFVADGISGSLAALFNSSLESGQIPVEWKSANVIPVPKGGDSERVENVRPISVLPVVVKVFEKLVHRQLCDYLQEHRVLHSAQSGFRPQHTTQDVLIDMIDSWRLGLDKNKLVGSVMLDLSKAFDLVPHSKFLLKKLDKYGVSGKELEWFREYLHGRRQRVCVEDVKSSWSDVIRGVPQGSILGPLLLLFIIVNDLPEVVKECDLKQYADDTTLSCVSNSADDLQDWLETDLANVSSWIVQNGLKLNVKKTQMLLMGRKSKAQDLDGVEVRLDGRNLPRMKKAKCLGVWVDDGLTWRDQVAAVRKKCFGGLVKLRRLRDVLPSSTKKKFYNALVLPHVDYCSVLW